MKVLDKKVKWYLHFNLLLFGVLDILERESHCSQMGGSSRKKVIGPELVQ